MAAQNVLEQAVSHAIAVKEICPAGAHYTPPPLERPVLFATLRGRSVMRTGGVAFRHEPGSLIVAASGCSVEEEVDQGEPWHVAYLFLEGEWADQLDIWLGHHPAQATTRALTPSAQRRFLEAVDAVLDRPAAWQWVLVARCAEIFADLYGNADEECDGALTANVARVLDDFPAHLLSIPEIAARLGVSARKLSYQFQKETGEPLARWVRKRRVQSARQLLAAGRSVSEVSEDLGFANPYHFSRVFKAVTGVPPSAVAGTVLFGGPNRLAAFVTL